MRKVVKTLFIIIFGFGLAFGAGACGGSKAPPAKDAAPTTTAVTLLPKPTGTSVLEITRPGAEPVLADFATLDHLATKTYKIVEPFEKKIIAFTGVELWTVLAGAGVPTTATEVLLTALDDYEVHLSVADIRKGGVILSTRADGEVIPLDHGGPMRLVFLDGVEAGSNPDQWIWSIKHIAVS
jgi:DMSO/TMAO reductase YedYZ molybdopterin-dependent catalytic subunit